MNDWIWGRLACLGKDVAHHLGWTSLLVNHQKARADYIVDAILDPGSRTRLPDLDPGLFSRADVFEIQREMSRMSFPENPPTAIVLDSFSELTDQRFFRKGEGWSFCSHYSDLIGDRLDGFHKGGLLAKELMPSVVVGMIGSFRVKWPEVPLFYLHFPAILDERPEFKERESVLSATLRTLQRTIPGVFSIEADPNLVEHDPHATPELRGFPYHFHPNVALDLASKLAAIIETTDQPQTDRQDSIR